MPTHTRTRTRTRSEHRATAGGKATTPRRGPLPPAPTRRQATPATLLRELAALLHSHGLHHLYGTANPTEGVLSIAYGITVWTNGHTLRCHTPTHTIHLPTSPHTAARYLANLNHHQPIPPQENTPCPTTSAHQTPHPTPPPHPLP